MKKHKNLIKKDVCVKLYDKKESLYFGTDVSTVDLCDRTTKGKKKTDLPKGHYTSQLHTKASCLALDMVQHHKRRSTRHTVQLSKVSPLVLDHRDADNYTPHATNIHL